MFETETFKISDVSCKTENVFDHCRLCRLSLNKIKLDKIVRQTDFDTLEKSGGYQKTQFRDLFRYQKIAYGIELGMDMWNSLEDLKTVLYDPKFKDFEIFEGQSFLVILRRLVNQILHNQSFRYGECSRI